MIINSINKAIDSLENYSNDYFQKSINDKKISSKIDDIFDFGASDKLNFNNLTEQELEQYLNIISKLLKKGIIGWKYYEVNGQIEKHFVETSIADQRLANAIPVKWNKVDKYY